MKTILISGCAGFIGCNLIERLSDKTSTKYDLSVNPEITLPVAE